MKVRLLNRCSDFEWRQVQATLSAQEGRVWRHKNPDSEEHVHEALSWNSNTLTADLGLHTLFEGMASGDAQVLEVAKVVILSRVSADIETIRYRQDVFRDCLRHPDIVRMVYRAAVKAVEKKGRYVGHIVQYPDLVLRNAIETMEVLIKYLRELGKIADAHSSGFLAEGWTRFFGAIRAEMDEDRLIAWQRTLESARFPHGILISAELGESGKGSAHRAHQRNASPGVEVFHSSPFELQANDEVALHSLGELKNRAIGRIANAVGQAADQAIEFFGTLRAELAFYIGCMNLYEKLTEKGELVCTPIVVEPGSRRLTIIGLYDAGLVLSIGGDVVNNDIDADQKNVIVVTGPNTGGKSTFLRSLGCAQLMMQAGMFVPATFFSNSVCEGLFTHYRRGEDVHMRAGKLDEELSRMSEIIDHVRANSIVLFNESFTSTNEREGAEIAREIIRALAQLGVRIIYVTHMYELAQGIREEHGSGALFLRAARDSNGHPTFRITVGEPLPTSHGEDLYDRIRSHPVPLP